MSKSATTAELLEKLRAAVESEGSQRAWAAKHGLSPQFVHDVLKERRGITDRIAEALGYRIETVYYPLEK